MQRPGSSSGLRKGFTALSFSLLCHLAQGEGQPHLSAFPAGQNGACPAHPPELLPRGTRGCGTPRRGRFPGSSALRTINLSWSLRAVLVMHIKAMCTCGVLSYHSRPKARRGNKASFLSTAPRPMPAIEHRTTGSFLLSLQRKQSYFHKQ